MLPGGQKILPIGAPNGSKKSGKNGNAKSKPVTPETDTTTSSGAAEEEMSVEGRGGEPAPSRKNGLDRFMFDKSKGRDMETS